VNAELLSKFTLGCDRAYLHVRPEGELSCEEGERYDRALGERSRGIPAVYITGHQEFWGMDFIVNFRCPDSAPTEHVVETVLELTRTGGRLAPVRSVRIVDVATGSGSIARASPRNCPIGRNPRHLFSLGPRASG
jgi:release factor glutamine methyltransferase